MWTVSDLDRGCFRDTVFRARGQGGPKECVLLNQEGRFKKKLYMRSPLCSDFLNNQLLVSKRAFRQAIQKEETESLVNPI